MSAAELSRRSVLRGAGVVAVAGVAGYAAAAGSDAASAKPAGAAANGYGPASGGGSGGSGGAALAALADVPDGGGLVLEDRDVVLVRDGDTVRAFSATCTHQGCSVSSVEDGQIRCPCHGSTFDASTGEVTSGPATTPLGEVAVTVRDGSVVGG